MVAAAGRCATSDRRRGRGTGTCDRGAGLLEALGAPSEPSGGLSPGGAALAGLRPVDLGPAVAVVWTGSPGGSTDNVTSTCRCSVPVGRPVDLAQKGATAEQVEQLESAMTHWAALLGRSADGRSAAVALGAGAGGGLGAALIRLGARRVPGIGTVLEAAGIARIIEGVDLVITGEGSFDWQSLRGKVVAGVASAALERAVPVVVLAGRVGVSRREWITAGVAAAFPAAAEPGESHREGVARAAARAARTWSRR